MEGMEMEMGQEMQPPEETERRSGFFLIEFKSHVM
jgi:hypothetical protein